MDRRTKYRHLLWWIICLDLLTVIWLGYRYLDRKIPDELYVTESQEQQVKNVLDYPLLSFDDAITVSGDGSYLLSSRILGVIPFKDVKVIPTDSTTVLVSGSTVGIYMETACRTGSLIFRSFPLRICFIRLKSTCLSKGFSI